LLQAQGLRDDLPALVRAARQVLPQERAVDVTLVRVDHRIGLDAVLSQDRGIARAFAGRGLLASQYRDTVAAWRRR